MDPTSSNVGWNFLVHISLEISFIHTCDMYTQTASFQIQC